MARNIKVYTNGLFNPRRTYYYSTGRLASELWHAEALGLSVHRLDGPAFTRWDENGKVIMMEWWINNNRVNMIDHPFVQTLKKYRLYSKWKRNELTSDDWVLIKMSMQL